MFLLNDLFLLCLPSKYFYTHTCQHVNLTYIYLKTTCSTTGTLLFFFLTQACWGIGPSKAKEDGYGHEMLQILEKSDVCGWLKSSRQLSNGDRGDDDDDGTTVGIGSTSCTK